MVMHSSTFKVIENQQLQRLISRRSFHSLWMLCLCAMMGLCSCVLSVEKEPPPQNANSPAQSSRQQKPPIKKATVDPNKFALVVAGVGGEDAYTKKFTAQATRLYEILTNQLGFSEKNVFFSPKTVSTQDTKTGPAKPKGFPQKRAQ